MMETTTGKEILVVKNQTGHMITDDNSKQNMKAKEEVKSKKLVHAKYIVIAAIFVAIICIGFFFLLLRPIPSWVKFQEKEVSFKGSSEDIDLKTVLKDQKVTVTCDGEIIWESSDEYLVQDMYVMDVIPADPSIPEEVESEQELVLLLWKKGRYGYAKPFWVKVEEKDWSQHMFFYTYFDGKIKSKWGSSYIGKDVQELLEKDGWLFVKTPKNEYVSYRWDSWGFTQLGSVNVLAVGDNLIHEQIYMTVLNKKGNYKSIYEPVKNRIMEADLAVVNQETPFVSDPSKYSGYPVFGTPSEVADALAYAGFDMATLATNHALDQGAEGLDSTIFQLEKNDMTCVGTLGTDKGSKVYSAYLQQQENHPGTTQYRKVYRNGLSLGILNYTYGTNGHPMPEEVPNGVALLQDEEQVKKDIETVKSETDAVLAFVHWGTENSEEIDEMQAHWRDLFYDAGVLAVIGSHPHVLQDYEMYQKDGNERVMLIYYSLGNFVSAQKESVSTKGGMADFTISITPEGCIISDYKLEPLEIIYDKGNVQVREKEDKKK